MKSKVILVEGITDAYLLAELFKSCKHYKEIKSGESEIKALPDYKKLEHCEYLKSSNDETLLIFACGSSSRFYQCYRTYFEVNAKAGKISRLAIITDSDKNTKDKIEKDITNSFESTLSFESSWKSNVVTSNEFGVSQTFNVDSLLLVIPPNSPGILEDAILDSIEENGGDSGIVIKEAKEFVTTLKTKQAKYLVTERIQKKANLAVSFGIFEPTHTFQREEAFFKSIHWAKYKNLVRVFDDILNI